jgi:hypothetical protein
MKSIGEFIGREQPRRTDDPDAGGVMTKHGWLSQQDLREAGAWIHSDENGRRIIRFKGLDDQGRAYFREIPDYKLAEGARS